MENIFNRKALDLFADKGDGNAVKVRRIISLTKRLASKNMEDLRILDLGCGEGVYSLEAGMYGSEVLGIDGRDDRLKFGKEVAEEHNLNNVKFNVDDVRNVHVDKYGKFDVIYNLGLLYHLDTEDVFSLLKRLHDMCNNMLIIDTTIGLSSPIAFEKDGETYYGVKYSEHEDGDDEELVMNKRIMASIGNNESFLITKESLIKYLNKIGFECIMECYSPLEPYKNESRVTIVAYKGKKEEVKAYPWINGMTEKEIVEKADRGTIVPFALSHNASFKEKLKMRLDKWLDKRGYKLVKKLRG